MSIQETLEQEFHTLLNECSRIHWKNLELELLIQYAKHAIAIRSNGNA